MKRKEGVLFLYIIVMFCLFWQGFARTEEPRKKFRLIVVSSCYKGDKRAEEAHRGFCKSLLAGGYFNDHKQIAEYLDNDFVETETAVIKRLWLADNLCRKSGKEKLNRVIEIIRAVEDFKPDLIFLEEDEAVEYVGSYFFNTEIPVVFWGLDNTPVKYGLVDNKYRPGHNVTGVYTSGYYAECMSLLKGIAPNIKTFAVLADNSERSRGEVKTIEYLSFKLSLPFKLAEAVVTDDFEIWKEKALALQKQVDAFFICRYSGLKDKKEDAVSEEDVAKWYINNINIPEFVTQRQYVEQGMFCGVDNPAFDQGFEAAAIANDILLRKANPAAIESRSPKRGAFIVNRQRAKKLGITLKDGLGIEGYIDDEGINAGKR